MKLPAEFYKEPYGTVDEEKVADEIARLREDFAVADRVICIIGQALADAEAALAEYRAKDRRE